uniref:Uncharacterized protein n=1 Tax=virus sp. ctah610 TaxID=2826807 RepID=A0A8S5R7R9_9VIRU|nr:MAG TPA: hypothetical protein [virus sp. ctah610]
MHLTNISPLCTVYVCLTIPPNFSIWTYPVLFAG